MSDSGSRFNDCLQLPAWCPSCGEKSLIDNSEKSLECQACGFVYYHNVAATSSAIIEAEQHFLMVIRGSNPCKDTLDFPGGFIEKHETAEMALQRELKEELGLTFNKEQFRYLCNFTNTYCYAGINYYTMDLYYLITLNEKPEISTNDEVSGFEWQDVHAIPEPRIGFDSVKNACRFYHKFRTGSVNRN